MQGLRRKLPFIGMFYILCISSHSYAATLYQITDIGTLFVSDEEAQQLKLRINDNKIVVGWEHTTSSPSSALRGFIWDSINGKTHPLALPESHQFYDISNSGNIVGTRYDENNKPIASLWNSNFNLTSIGTLGGSESIAYAINENNKVAGQSENSNAIQSGFYWEQSTGINPFPFDETNTSSIEAVNNNNWLAGTVNTTNGMQAFFYDTNTVINLDALDNKIISGWTSDLNNLNQAIGGVQYLTAESFDPRFVRTYAYRWDKTQGLQLIGEQIQGVSWATGMNDQQQIVGGRLVNVIDRQAALWEGDNVFNLNLLTQNIDTWQLLDATDVNNNGVIVGIGKRFGFYHAYLLEPAVSSVASADLAIDVSVSNPSSKMRSRQLELDASKPLNVYIRNHGPDEANNIIFSLSTDLPLTTDNVSLPQNQCEVINNRIDCDIDQLNPLEELVVTFDLQDTAAGEYDFRAEITADELDPGINENNKILNKIALTPDASPVVNSPGQQSSNQEDDQSTPDTSDQDSSTAPTSSSANSGCSMGNQNAFDPMLLTLIGISIVRILRLKQKTG